MHKLVALYRQPEDPESFDEHYYNEHLPLVREMPELKKTEVSRVEGAPMGETDYYMQCDMYFEDREQMMQALQSDEGMAAASDLQSFAGELVEMYFAEVEELD